jgi:hypothetical protein
LGPATPSALGCGAVSPNPRTTTMVFIRPIDGVPSQYKSEKPVAVNGVKAYFVPIDTAFTVYVYDLPSLGVQVNAQGRLAGRIVSTLTRSPRTVSLATGPAPLAPSLWRSVSYAGVCRTLVVDSKSDRGQSRDWGTLRDAGSHPVGFGRSPQHRPEGIRVRVPGPSVTTRPAGPARRYSG